MHKPLNGTKTHPMGAPTLRVLAKLKDGPIPKARINPGVVDRLSREGLIDFVQLPSPFKKDKGGTTTHLRLRALAAGGEA